MRVTRSIVSPVTVAVAVLALGGLAACSGQSGQPPATSSTPSMAAPSTAPPPSSSVSTSADSSTSPSTRQQTASFGLLDAIVVAHKAESGAVTDAELSRFGETSAWKVDVRKSRTVTVEIVVTGDGKVVSKTDGDTDDEARTAPAYAASAAIKAAQQRVDGQATSVELDESDGKQVWDVKISRPGDQPVDVTYDADSGKFLRQAVDS